MCVCQTTSLCFAGHLKLCQMDLLHPLQTGSFRPMWRNFFGKLLEELVDKTINSFLLAFLFSLLQSC